MNGAIVSPAMRDRVRGLAVPFASFLGRLGLTPNGLTVIGFLGTVVAAVAAAAGWWLAAGILVVVFGIFDLFDGTLARATGKTSRFGAFLDSTLDRAGEAVVYLGVAVGAWLTGYAEGALLAAAAMAAAFMVSYTRSKSESLGFTPGTGMANIGLAPREVRVGILALGLILMGLEGGHLVQYIDCVVPVEELEACWYAAQHNSRTIFEVTLGLIAVLATVTTIQRILHVRSQARED